MPKKKDPAKFSASYKRLLAVLELQCGRQLNKTEVARIFNVSPQRVGQWEDRNVPKMVAIQAQTMFGCRAAWLLDGEGPRSIALPLVEEVREPAPIYLGANVVPLPQITPMMVISELGKMLQKLETEEHRRAVAGTLASFANSGGNPLFHKMLMAAFDPQEPPRILATKP